MPGAGTCYWRVNHYDLTGNESGYAEAGSFNLVDDICGDVNGDEGVNIGDAVYLGNVIFHPGSPGPCAACP